VAGKRGKELHFPTLNLSEREILGISLSGCLTVSREWIKDLSTLRWQLISRTYVKYIERARKECFDDNGAIKDDEKEKEKVLMIQVFSCC
tara:strand:+ start:506 stop:775 length:270 start_codon:yes stop_codon:yes gene_type:complete